MATPTGKSRLTAPGREPVSEQEVKDQLRLDHSDDDGQIDRLVTAARQHVEQFTGQVIVRQQWRLYFDNFSDVMEVSPAYVREIAQIQYLDSDGNTQTLATSNYDFDMAQQRVLRAYGQTWPSTRPHPNAVWVDVWSGMYDETGSPIDELADVDEAIKQACLMVIQHLFDGTENHGADLLLQPYRQYRL